MIGQPGGDTVKVRTAFVSGGTGFLGLALIEELTAQNWNVWALHRPESNLEFLKGFPVHLVPGDVTDRPSLMRGMPEDLDAVFHVAGSTNVWSRRNAEQNRINIDGTRNMVEAALARNAGRFIHTSTISVYGLQKGIIDETSPKLGEVSWINYQRSKFLAEKEVYAGIDRGLDAVLINPASILGRYDTTGWARLVRLVHAGKLPGVPPGKASFCHVRSVAKAHVAAADHGRSGENYLLGGTDASYMDMVAIASTLAGREPPARPTAPWLMRFGGRMGQLTSLFTRKEPRLTPEAVAMVCREIQCNCDKARRDLGYDTVSLKEMVEDSYRWLAQQGLLEPGA